MPEDKVALHAYQSLALPIALLSLALSFVSLGFGREPGPRGPEGVHGEPGERGPAGTAGEQG
jgi:hypothetical protein